MDASFEKKLNNLVTLSPAEKVVVAVSGGVDSIVLLHLMQSIPVANRPSIIVAHVNHQLRPESDEEELFVRSVAESYNVPFYIYNWERSEHPDSGIEKAARIIRYTFFEDVMVQTKADLLMTAHHQDDQVETILMRLTRGSSLQQMTGIKAIQPFRSGQLIRPLLPFSKEEIYQYAKIHDLIYMEDATNQEVDYTRNRFRQNIIPLLKDENPKFNETVEQLISDLKDVLAISKEPIEDAFQNLVTIHEDSLEFDLTDFTRYSKPMQRSLIVEMLQSLYSEQEKTYKTNYIELIQQWLLHAEGNSQLQLTNHIRIVKSYTQIAFHNEQNASEQINSDEQQSIFTLDETQLKVQLSPTETLELKRLIEEDATEILSNNALVFHADAVQFPLTIRHRQLGDRMTYKGLEGTKKIKDILIDEKVPLLDREKAWIVEDANGKIIWLIPYRKMYLLSQAETDKLSYILNYNKKKSEGY